MDLGRGVKSVTEREERGGESQTRQSSAISQLNFKFPALHFSLLPSDFRGNSGVEEDVSLFARSLPRSMHDRQNS